MRPPSRHSYTVLCLLIAGVFSACSPGAAEPAPTDSRAARITGVRTLETGKIEIGVALDTPGDFESGTESTPTFRVRENGVVQDSLFVEPLNQEENISRTVLLADVSRSLSRKQFAAFKRAALAFVDRLKPGHRVALIVFHSKVYRELNFTSDRELLRKRILRLKQSGRRTMLYDALVEAHKMLEGTRERRAIVLYTDGKENASRVKMGDLIERYTANPVPLFAAGKGKSSAMRAIIRLARISGGDAFRAAKAEDLGKIFHYLSRLKSREFRLTYKTQQKPGATVDLTIEHGTNGQQVLKSYTLPSVPTGLMPVAVESEKLFSAGLFAVVRTHMPEVLLALITLLLIAVIIMLFFRRQEITVKVENTLPPALVTGEEFQVLPQKKAEHRTARLPLDYYHGWLVEKEGPHTGRKYRINWHLVTLGFGDDNSIVIDDNTVSPRHAKIERDGTKFILYDLMSENGTFLNGRKLLRPKELNDFDEIGVGRTRLIFRKSASTYEKTRDAIEHD